LRAQQFQALGVHLRHQPIQDRLIDQRTLAALVTFGNRHFRFLLGWVRTNLTQTIQQARTFNCVNCRALLPVTGERA